MPDNKNVPIKYTSRDFKSIKEDLIEHAKRYYPDNYNDFSEASFGSMIFDTVAYVGDVLSYYLDYSVNESFIDTAVEFGNVRKHARNLGYKFAGMPVSNGILSFFILVPSNSHSNGPNYEYVPILKKGSEFQSVGGTTFSLLEDVDFNSSTNDVIAVKMDQDDGMNTHFAIRAYGKASSGRAYQTTADLSNATFEKFRKVRVGGPAVTEIINVTDSEGNKYYEVDYLSQETVFIETTNPNAFNDGVRSILKPFVTARRFVVYQDDTGTYLQFGFGSDDDDNSGLTDPSTVALKMHARDHITHTAIDPTRLLGTDKLGISPQGTTLTIVYKSNDGAQVNAGVNAIRKISNAVFRFKDQPTLDSNLVQQVKDSIEVTNDKPIVGAPVDFSIDELKIRSKNLFATQNRAVTKMDYEAIAYNMPTKFGQIKRANIINNPFATNKELVMYVIGINRNNHLEVVNSTTKGNLVSWLGHYASINDIVRIDDAKIINFGIEFEVVTDKRYDSAAVLLDATRRVKSLYSAKFYIGEPIYLNRIYNILSKTEGVIDVNSVLINNKTGTVYSSTQFVMDDVLSQDATYYRAPKNVVFEIKYPDSDIRGKAI
jgi:hypothetical protein